MYNVTPIAGLSGAKPNDKMYKTWATPNAAIPIGKRSIFSRRSPIEDQINPITRYLASFLLRPNFFGSLKNKLIKYLIMSLV